MKGVDVGHATRMIFDSRFFSMALAISFGD